MTPPCARSTPGRRSRHLSQRDVPDGLGRPQLRQITRFPIWLGPRPILLSRVAQYRPDCPISSIPTIYLHHEDISMVSRVSLVPCHASTDAKRACGGSIDERVGSMG